MFGWLAHWFGLDNAAGPAYLFWSGIGSDLGELAILGAVVQWYRKHTCHVDGCNRLGHLPVNGTQYHTCRRHHPTGGITHGHILTAHAKSASDAEQGRGRGAPRKRAGEHNDRPARERKNAAKG